MIKEEDLDKLAFKFFKLFTQYDHHYEQSGQLLN